MQPYIYGLHAVHAALINPKRQCHKLWVTKETLKTLENIKKPANLQITIFERREFSNLVGENATHQGIVLQADPLPHVHLEDYLKTCPQQTLCIILDQVLDPHNVGAILRSATAFGASAVVQTDVNAPDINNSIIAKVACGTVERIPLISVTNLSRTLATLKQHQFWIMGLEENGQQWLHELEISGRMALVLGSEGKGLRRMTKEHCDYLIKLPTQDQFSTLNVSNAAAVACYEYQRQILQETKKRKP